jgi:hypothetical protein
MKKLTILAAGLLLVACTKPAPLGPQPLATTLGPQLNAQQIRGEIVGNTGTGTRTGTTTKWSVYVAPEGTLAMTSAQPNDSGTYKITDDGHLCMTFKAAFDGREVCQTVHKAGTALQFASPRSVEELTFVPGNKL